MGFRAKRARSRSYDVRRMHARIPILLLLLSTPLLSACAQEQGNILERELSAYRYEQEKYRREKLEDLYEVEEARAEELTRLILAVREAINSREGELEELRERLHRLEGEIDEVREKVAAAEKKAAKTGTD